MAHQWYLTGNHSPNCPLELLAVAGEKCWFFRDESPQEKQDAENSLSGRIDALLAAMKNVPKCPFPVCQYPSELGHRLECPFHGLRS